MNKIDANMNSNNLNEIVIGKGENIEQQDLPEEIQLPEVIPLLPIRDLVLFPFMIIPLFVGREASIKAVDEALSKDRLILLSAQKDIIVEEPSQNDIYDVGVVAMIMKMLKLPDGRVKILVQGLSQDRNICSNKTVLSCKSVQNQR